MIWCVRCNGLRIYPAGRCPSCRKAVPRLDFLFVAAGEADERAHRDGFVKEHPILPTVSLVISEGTEP